MTPQTNLNLIKDINKVVHEPSRLTILVILSSVTYADFNYLLHVSNLTKGNLSRHISKLEEAKLLTVEKKFIGKIPNTIVKITTSGENELKKYLQIMHKLGK